MNKKNILILAVVLAALIAGVILKQTRQPPELVSEDFSTLALKFAEPAVQSIHVERAGKELLVINRAKTGWTLPSLWNAPAAEKKVTEFLGMFSEARGELRARDAALLNDFGIADAQALSLQLRDAQGIALLDLRVATKRAGGGQVFLRRAGSNDVYLADLGLFNALGIYGEADQPDVKAEVWADLQPMKFKSSDVAALKIQRFENGKPSVVASVKKDGDGKAPWVFETKQTRFQIDPARVASFIGQIENLRARSVVDPAGEYGLKAPVLQIRLEGSTPGVLNFGNENADKSQRYAQVEGQSFVYAVSQFQAQELFTDDSRFFKEKPFDSETTDLEAVVISTQGSEKRFTPAEAEIFIALKDRLESLTVVGLIGESQKAKVGLPGHEWIRFERKGGKLLTLDFGDKLAQDFSGSERRAAAVRDEKEWFAVSESDYGALFQPAKATPKAAEPATPPQESAQTVSSQTAQNQAQ